MRAHCRPAGGSAAVGSRRLLALRPVRNLPSMRNRTVLLIVVLLAGLGGGLLAQRTVKPPLHGRHWMAITGKPLGATAGAMIFQQGRQRRRRRLRDARRRLHDVGHARLGRRDAGADLQPEDRQGHRHQRARRRADRRHARVLPRQGHGLPARVRPARGGDAGHAGRPDGDARRVRHDEPEGRARAGHPDGRRLPDRAAGGRRHRAPEARDQEVALVGEGVPHAPRRGARGAERRARSSSSPTSPPRCASWSTPSSRR